MRTQQIQYFRPTSQKDAAVFLAENPNARLIAGGTDILVKLKNGALPQLTHLVDIRRLSMSDVVKHDGKILIGSGCTMTKLASDPLIVKQFPVISDSAHSVGALQIRNMATVGGNVANASPAGDTIPALMALDAEVVLKGPKEVRRVPIHAFFSGPGKSMIQPGELIEAFELEDRIVKGAFLKLGNRLANAISKISLTLATWEISPSKNHFRITLGAVAPTVIRCKEAEKILENASAPFSKEVLEMAQKAVIDSAKPIDDIRSDKTYRKQMGAVLLKKALISIGCLST